MRKTVVLSMCLLLAASMAPAERVDRRAVDVPKKMSTMTDEDAWRELLETRRVRRAPAVLDTTFLLVHEFEGAGAGCEWVGWTRNDATRQLDNYWHVDDFAGLSGVNGGLVPLEGDRSMWCGARPDPAHPVKCSYQNLPGYADHWYQWIGTEQCLTVTGDVDLSFRIFWNSEVDDDFTYVQWNQCDDDWQDLVAGGLDGLGAWDTTLTVPDSLHSGHVRFRFLFRSDVSNSDGDGGLDTDGGCTIDMLQVTDGGGVVLALEDFEDEAVGDLDADGWISETAPGFGELANLFWGSRVLQEDPCFTNQTCIWGFFNGSTADYGCATPVPHAGQMAVPYENARGQYVDQQIWSPWIELSGTGAVVELAFDTYWDLPSNGFLFSDWHVRGIDSTAADLCPSEWFDDGVADFGDDRAWHRSVHSIGSLIPPGSTHIQVSLDVIDYCQFGGFPCVGVCHSHSPLYDNVTVYRLGSVGPQWAVQDMHQFQDSFPEDGTITGTARADMAMDLNWDEPAQAIVPGDSAVVHVSDPANGLALDATSGKAAVYCFVDVDGPHGATAATGLITDARYTFVGARR